MMPGESDQITIRDLIYLYLRELDLVQKSIERVETDMRQHCTMNNEDYNRLNDELSTLKDTVNTISTNLSDLINRLKIENIEMDNEQNQRIWSLEFKMSAYGFIAGIFGFITSDLFLKLFTMIFN